MLYEEKKKGFCFKTKGFSLNNLGKSSWKFFESIGKVCLGGLQEILNF